MTFAYQPSKGEIRYYVVRYIVAGLLDVRTRTDMLFIVGVKKNNKDTVASTFPDANRIPQPTGACVKHCNINLELVRNIGQDGVSTAYVSSIVSDDQKLFGCAVNSVER